MANQPNEDKVGIICRTLRRAIVEQALKPGDRLPEDALGERFGVSRTIARHALGQLAAEGLVDLRRNRMATIATPSYDEARDAFEIRNQLERLVVKALAGRLQRAQIVQLQKHVEAEKAARTGSKAASIRLATEFHVLLAEITKKPLLARYVTEISYRCGLILSAFGHAHSSECAVSEHSALIDMLAKGDVEASMRMMSEHLDGVFERAVLDAPKQAERSLIDVLAPYLDS